MQYWDPKQYQKFARERTEPFYDLVQLIRPLTRPRILDIGSGDGILTKYLHEELKAGFTLGIDSSPEMLQKARLAETSSLTFKQQNIASFGCSDPFNLIVSNAALQWVPDHPAIFKQLTELLATGGQIAVQMPANQQYPTHTIARDLASENPYRPFFEEVYPTKHVLEPEEYARLLDRMGFENQIIRIQLYSHYLESTATVLEWVKGSLLTYYQSRLEPALYDRFLKEYRTRLFEKLGWSEPFFFLMKRLFIWAQLPTH